MAGNTMIKTSLLFVLTLCGPQACDRPKSERTTLSEADLKEIEEKAAKAAKEGARRGLREFAEEIDSELRKKRDEPTRKANVAGAISQLRFICTAQLIFRESDRDNDGKFDFGSIEELINAELLKPLNISYSDGHRRCGFHITGYTFATAQDENFPEYKWWANANPVKPGEPGALYLFINESGTVWVSDKKSIKAKGPGDTTPSHGEVLTPYAEASLDPEFATLSKEQKQRAKKLSDEIIRTSLVRQKRPPSTWKLESLKKAVKSYNEIMPPLELANTRALTAVAKSYLKEAGIDSSAEVRESQKESSKKEDYQPIAIEIKLNASFSQLVKFMNNLEKHQHFLSINSFEFTINPDSEGSIQASITVISYKHRSLHNAETKRTPNTNVEQPGEDHRILAELRETRNRLKKRTEAQLLTDQMVSTLERCQSRIINISRSKIMWSQKLTQLSEIFVEYQQAWISSMSVCPIRGGGSSFTLICSTLAKDADKVAKLVVAIRKNKKFSYHFSSINCSKPTKRTERGQKALAFEIKMPLKN